MNVVLLGVLFGVIYPVQTATTFHCFYCHQTSKDCNNGVKLNLHAINCTTNKCFVLQYETEMPGVTVLATIRGCYQRPDHEMMGTVVTERHSVIKKHFHLCNHTLCNEGTENFRIRQSIRTLLLVQIVYFLYFWT
uniref:Uncharacterized protein LOC114330996 n=1 Tax=Diabrotica virgifera virgifera TaxID=50390 RepID=A0A6P7FTG8_DIAVI